MLSLLFECPDISQVELASKLGITQPAVCLRLKKLQEKGVIKKILGMNPDDFSFSLVRCNSLDEFSNDPHFVFGFECGDGAFAVLFGVDRGDKITKIAGNFVVPVRSHKECCGDDYEW